MPNYKNKRMTPADRNEFLSMLEQCQTSRELAFITALYYTGARVSEVLALNYTDVYVSGDKVYIKITRLKHSAKTRDISFFLIQTGISELLNECMIAEKEQRLIFPFSRWTGRRITHRVAGTYPHFFRYNRFADVVERYGLLMLKQFGGITIDTANRYMLEKKLGEMVIE